MGDLGPEPSHNGAAKGKKQILLNAFDMSTVGHLSPGQWKVSHQHLFYIPAPNKHTKKVIHRTQRINQPQSAISNIGLNWQSSSNAVGSMPYFWLIRMAAMIRTRANWMNAFDERHNGP